MTAAISDFLWKKYHDEVIKDLSASQNTMHGLYGRWQNKLNMQTVSDWFIQLISISSTGSMTSLPPWQWIKPETHGLNLEDTMNKITQRNANRVHLSLDIL